MYQLERKVFTAVDLRCPREFPLDLAVSVGVLALPLTIAADLLIMASLPKLDFVTMAMLAVSAVAMVVAVLLRLYWLLRVWRSRIGSKGIRPRERLLPDGSVVLVRSGAYGAVLVATGYIFMEITAAADPSISIPLRILSILFLGPVLAWSLTVHWWYRLQRELASCGRCMGLRLVRAPLLSVVPSLSLIGLVVFFFPDPNPSGPALAAFVLLIFVGFVGAPISIYRMGLHLEKLRHYAVPRSAWKAHAAGLRAAAMVVVPVAAILYCQRSLDQISLQIATTAPLMQADVLR